MKDRTRNGHYIVRVPLITLVLLSLSFLIIDNDAGNVVDM
jgi:hypothetical protein